MLRLGECSRRRSVVLKPNALKHRLRRRFGPSLQRLAFRSGLMERTRGRDHGGALVLMYHSVADASDAVWIDPRNHVPAEVFAEQMAYLARHRKVIALEQLVRALEGGEDIEDGTIVLTFDDGYRDNLTVAAPILAQWQLPATLFLPTGYIDRGETQWVDQAYTAFRCRSRDSLAWPGKQAPFDLDDLEQAQSAYQSVCLTLLEADPETRRCLLDMLLTELEPTSAPPRLTLNWDEVGELVSKYEVFSIGGHTTEHRDLTHASPAAARDELQQCAADIEEQIGRRADHFSFCYGRSNDELRGLIGELGIRAAFGGSQGGPVITRGGNPLRLPRVEGPRSMEQFPLAVSTANVGFWRRLSR